MTINGAVSFSSRIAGRNLSKEKREKNFNRVLSPRDRERARKGSVAAALIKHSTRSGPESRSGCGNNWALRGPVKVPEGSQARTKGNDGAPTRSLTSETPRLEALVGKGRSLLLAGRGADQEHGSDGGGGCQVEVNGCSPRGKGASETLSDAALSMHRQVSRGKNAVVVWPIPFFPAPSLLVLPLAVLLLLSFSSPCFSPRSTPTPVGRYVAIGHSWPGSMMLAARV